MRYFNPKKIVLSPIRPSSASDIYEYSYTYFDLEFLFHIRQTFELSLSDPAPAPYVNHVSTVTDLVEDNIYHKIKNLNQDLIVYE